MQTLISEIFLHWAEGPLARYRFADQETYASVGRIGLYQASLNPYLKTEADIQMKFGGFLEAELMRTRSNLTVHAELNTYRDRPNLWADLSVHDVSAGGLWTERTPNPIIKTVKAVIEVKYANYRDPNWVFAKGYVRSDLEKLTLLPTGIARILLLLDESLDIHSSNIDATLAFATENNISILSNNKTLMYVA